MRAIRNPEQCDHAAIQHRRKTRSNGTFLWCLQCVGCGRCVRDCKRVDVPEPALSQPVEFDTELEQSGRELAKRHKAEAAKARRGAWRQNFFQRHGEYLKSEAWRQRRQRVLERDGFVCQACGTARAVEVHHKTYDHWGREPLFDLVAICHACHVDITTQDRTARQVRADLNEVWRQRLKQQSGGAA